MFVDRVVFGSWHDTRRDFPRRIIWLLQFFQFFQFFQRHTHKEVLYLRWMHKPAKRVLGGQEWILPRPCETSFRRRKADRQAQDSGLLKNLTKYQNMKLHIRATTRNKSKEDYTATSFNPEEDGWHLVLEDGSELILKKDEYQSAIVVSFEPFEA
jgi:hypothetical protein